jgi:hypothetical protein
MGIDAKKVLGHRPRTRHLIADCLQVLSEDANCRQALRFERRRSKPGASEQTHAEEIELDDDHYHCDVTNISSKLSKFSLYTMMFIRTLLFDFSANGAVRDPSSIQDTLVNA